MAVDTRVTLAELRRELYTALDAESRKQFQFQVEQMQLTLDVEFSRDQDGGVMDEVGLPAAKVGGQGGAVSGGAHCQMLTVSPQIYDEGLGSRRAKIRRRSTDTTGTEGLRSHEGKVDVPPGFSGAEQKRPWER